MMNIGTQVRYLRRSALAIALIMSMAAGPQVLAQATSGSLFGQAEPGEHVQIQNESGLSREADVDARGRYTFNNLPLGSYKVTLLRNGKAVDSRDHVNLLVGAGTEVSFASSAVHAKNLGAVTVTAKSEPAIDVTSVDSRTVITSQQLARLPLARTAEAIAMLAPGAVAGSSGPNGFVGPTGNSLVSFSGSSVTENAYYINGFNATDPVSGFGGFQLPYNSIEQEEVLSGGYGAAYGRSDGGVISQVGKRGTNEWHFGGQILWTPKSLQGDPPNIYYKSGTRAGTIYRRTDDNKSWITTVSGYASGPLIKDKLFFFLSAEAERREGRSIGSVDGPTNTKYRYDDPKWYAKFDWNINDSNILEVTGVSSKHEYGGSVYRYSYANEQPQNYISPVTKTKDGADLWTGKYTSYITDDLTLTALYGKMKGTYYTDSPFLAPGTPPYIFRSSFQNPALNDGRRRTSNNTNPYYDVPDHTSKNSNLRIDLTYKIGDHTVTGGIDNQTVRDNNDGQLMTGPGYAWLYDKNDPNEPISGQVGQPGGLPGGDQGYYVTRYILATPASVRVVQHAQYLEDSWQINDRLLLKLGIRNDQFTNYNPDGVAYIRQTSPQWAPRLGLSWDVNGDSSLKIYGNAGRYYLALPASVALRAAGAPTYTQVYYTYTGIDASGVPQGLTPIPTSRGPGAPISGNNEFGQARDPKTAASTNLKSEYQDEYILGLAHQFDPAWVWGAKATVRKLRNAIDDVADVDSIDAKAESLGYDPATFGQLYGSYLFNPGRSNTFLLNNTNGGYYEVPMSSKDFGFGKLKRNYYGLDIFLEHPFDGKWQGHIDYLYSRSYGNTEGQVRSDIQQGDVSATADWDFAQLMQNSNGYLSNDIKHQIKAYGSYQISPEWMVAGNVQILSGTPRSCLGRYGVNEGDPVGYDSQYHYCAGKPSRPGDAGRNPWQYIFSINGEYRPDWAGHKLGFNAYVYNLFNQRRSTQWYAEYGSTEALDFNYRRSISNTTPRYVRFGVAYDF